MKKIKENAISAPEDFMTELNSVLDKYSLGNVHIEAIRLKKGKLPKKNCRRVCRLWTNPRTGEQKVICKIVCK